MDAAGLGGSGVDKVGLPVPPVNVIFVRLWV